MPYLSASKVMIHEELLYQVYLPLPLPFTFSQEESLLTKVQNYVYAGIHSSHPINRVGAVKEQSHKQH